jgi:hypothetical protein
VYDSTNTCFTNPNDLVELLPVKIDHPHSRPEFEMFEVVAVVVAVLEQATTFGNFLKH